MSEIPGAAADGAEGGRATEIIFDPDGLLLAAGGAAAGGARALARIASHDGRDVVRETGPRADGGTGNA